MARLVGFPVAEAASTPQDAPVDTTTAVPTTTVATTAPLPDLPEDGLILIRTARTAEPQPIVRRVVVQQQQSPGQAAATQAPQKTTQSAGS
jgi:hypothetical protein